jgi:hypothetical protein
MCVPREEGWDTGVERSISIKPNSKILIETHLAFEARGKTIALYYFYLLANVYFGSKNSSNLTDLPLLVKCKF